MTTTSNGRRYSNHPFPPYRYLPGCGLPHPRTDPQGHSYGEYEVYLPSFEPADWSTCDTYLYGIDLFNAGYYWEAHEAFETLWLAAGQKATPCGRYLQGMIQLSAAILKQSCGESSAAASLLSSARTSFASAEGLDLGFDLAGLLDGCEGFLARGELAPIIVLDQE